MTWPTLRNAPIVEALLDVQAPAPSGTDVKVLSELPVEAQAAYPARQERAQMRHSFALGGGSHSSSTQVDGYLFRSADGKHVVQQRLDGFSFSRLAPYDKWDAFAAEARARWKDYRKVITPQTITRVGLRFVNRIDVSRKVEDLSSYFQSFPGLPNTLPRSLSSLFMRVGVPVEAATVILTLAVDEANVSDLTIPFFLDIDAFELRTFDVNGDDDLWATLERLRRLKNWFFFESITSKTREMFE